MRKIISLWLMLLISAFSIAQNKITGYEYWLDNNASGKVSVSVTPTPSLNLKDNINITGISSGLHILNIRFKDNNNKFSVAVSEMIYGFASGGNISEYKYWFDNDYANTVIKTISNPQPNASMSIPIDASKLKNGLHIINIMFKASGGLWSSAQSEMFIKRRATSSVENLITGIRYWYGDDVNTMTSISISNPAKQYEYISGFDYEKMAKNKYYLNYQFKDTTGLYSPVTSLRLGPFARFEAINMLGFQKFTVNFNNHSLFGETFKWLFDDGETGSLVNPSHTYKQPGAYKVSLIANNTAGTDTFRTYVSIKGLAKVEATHAGNIGDATVRAYGGFFAKDSKFYLRKDGQPDIIGDTVLHDKPGVISTTFDLRNKPVGKYDVIIEMPGDTTMILKDGFTIETGKPADPWVQINTRDRILINRWNFVTINYGNNGNVDATGVPLWLAVSDNNNLEIEFVDLKVVHSKYVIDKGSKPSFDTMSIFFKTSRLFGEDVKMKVYPFYIPVIPAGSSYSVRIKMKAYGNMNYNIQAWMTKPYYQSPLDIAVAQCMISILGEGVVDVGTAAVPGVGCAWSIGKLVYNPYQAYRPNEPDTWGSWLWNVAVTGVDCGINLSGMGAIAKGVGVLIANMANYASAFISCRDMYNCKNRTNNNVRAASSFDPNEMKGPDGFASENYVNEKTFPYKIYFENKSSATAPAHEVSITDTLDLTKFDLKTFSFGPVTFGDTIITPVFGLNRFSVDISMKPKLNFITRISGTLDTVKGIVKWQLSSLDPVSYDMTEDPDLGFLPPNVNSPEGEGSVSYSVALKSFVANNDIIKNKAEIIFDSNAPIMTNEYFNTLDLKKPASHVLPLPAVNADSVFTVSWTGTDGESGIRDYSVYVLVNDTGFVAWKINTPGTSEVFKGKKHFNYKFYSIATDSTGNMEQKSGFDTETTMGIDNLVGNGKDYLAVYPNPAEVSTMITYYVSSFSDVSIDVYNILGERIINLVNARKTAGIYNLRLPYDKFNTGIYYINLKTESSSLSRPLIVNK